MGCGANERAIRPIALNKKNALFAGHDHGAIHWVIVASFIETAKLNGVDPQAYLAGVLNRLVNGWPMRQIDELLPWAGTFAGSYLTAPGSAAMVRAIYERVFGAAHPIFATGEFKIKSGASLNMSLLALPLSDEGTNVNMAISSLIPRFNFDLRPSDDWLKDLPVKVRDVVDICDVADIEKRSLDWERYCDARRRRAEGYP